jgi:hypothetical protein
MCGSRQSVLLADAIVPGGPTRLLRAGLKTLRWWCGQQKSLQALANINDDHLDDLSEIGQRLRRTALHRRIAAAQERMHRASPRLESDGD